MLQSLWIRCLWTITISHAHRQWVGVNTVFKWSCTTPSTKHLLEGQCLLSIRTVYPRHINEADVYSRKYDTCVSVTLTVTIMSLVLHKLASLHCVMFTLGIWNTISLYTACTCNVPQTHNSHEGCAHTDRGWSASTTTHPSFTTTQVILTTTHNKSKMLKCYTKVIDWNNGSFLEPLLRSGQAEPWHTSNDVLRNLWNSDSPQELITPQLKFTKRP